MLHILFTLHASDEPLTSAGAFLCSDSQSHFLCGQLDVHSSTVLQIHQSSSGGDPVQDLFVLDLVVGPYCRPVGPYMFFLFVYWK